MAKNPEQVLRDITSEHVFRIAQLVSELECAKEEVQKLTEENKKLNQILTGNSGNDQ